MSIFSVITNLFKPAGEIIDNLHTSEEEKQTLHNTLENIHQQVIEKVLAYGQKILEAQTSIITTEASGQSWLQRNWRPITMMTFLVLITLDCFGILHYRLSGESWSLLKIGLGGYVIGRSGEKIIGTVGQIIASKKQG